MNSTTAPQSKTTAAISLELRQFRPIAEATIDIDSITVLSGVNACGKSSIARLLHALVNFNSNYTQELLRFEVAKIQAVVDTFLDMLKNIPVFVRPVPSLSSSASIGDIAQSVIEWAESILKEWGNISADPANTRLVKVFLRDIGYPGIEATSDKIISFIQDKFDEIIEEYSKLSKQRTLFPFQQHKAFPALFGRNAGAMVDLFEYGDSIYHSEEPDSGKIPVTHPMRNLMGIKTAIYITSPFINTPIMENGKLSLNDGFPIEIKNQSILDDGMFRALHGKMSFSSIGGSLECVYERDDGHAPFDWKMLATGIKSLAILNVLYANGCLNNKTLLIIDEPEVHLHPQWVFEYARILSLFAKKLNVRILLATHSPEMVESIKAIAEAEQIAGVRFYVADEADTPYQYKFRDIGMNVEPIFKKFNVALDRMDTYEPATIL